MKILRIIDILRNKEGLLKVHDDLIFSYKEKILVKTPKEIFVAEILELPKDDIPGIKYNEDFSFLRKLTSEEILDFESSQEGSQTRAQKAQSIANKLKLKMHFFASNIGWQKRMTSFFFTSDDQVDFRDLLKLLVKEFSGRIHLERVSMRERTRIIGGFGPCGRGESCCQFTRFNNQKVSLNAVRDQGIMINNNSKIFGIHGKIKTCMLYEIENYKKNRKYAPHMKQIVQIGKNQKGRVVGIDILNRKVKVQLENDVIDVFDVKDLVYENKKEAPKEIPLDFEKYKISIEESGI